jgi:alanyl-tRNA synthetase
MTSSELRQKYIQFFLARDHREIKPAKLVLQDDLTTLFTSSGMQPLVPFLLGEKHPLGDRLVDSQPSFRAEDMDEVGDNRHTTFFEMLGNWGLGSYFKKEQLPWIWEFLIKDIGLPVEKVHVSIFEGNDFVPKDIESKELWLSLGVPSNHIHEYGVKKNWWSRSGTPDKMPVGEIGGPDSEIFYDFGIERKFHENSEWKDQECHPNCDCGRFMEIGN